MHDQTAVKTEGIEDLLRKHPTVTVTVDAGYQGLAKTFPDQVHAPPPKPRKDAPTEQIAVYEQARKQQSSRRICVEHAIAEPKQWRSLQALDRAPPGLRPDPCGRRWAGRRPGRPPLIGSPTHQPDPSGRHAPTPIANGAPSR
jgi:hypothetical protein